MRNTQTTQRGFTQLVAIILISVIGISIALAILPIGVSSLRGSFAIEHSFAAAENAEACGELALLALKEDSLFSGPLAYNTAGIECSSDTENTLLGDGDHAFTINTIGISQEYTKRIQLRGIIASGTPIAITEWRSVAGF